MIADTSHWSAAGGSERHDRRGCACLGRGNARGSVLYSPRMRHSELRARVERSRIARAGVFPMRLRAIARYDGQVVRRSLHWLMTSRENTNWTYELDPLNAGHLAWWVANATGKPIVEISGYLDELRLDHELRAHLIQARRADPQWRVADPEPAFGRRSGWYALVRALQPQHVVETGTDKGLGSSLPLRCSPMDPDDSRLLTFIRDRPVPLHLTRCAPDISLAVGGRMSSTTGGATHMT